MKGVRVWGAEIATRSASRVLFSVLAAVVLWVALLAANTGAAPAQADAPGAAAGFDSGQALNVANQLAGVIGERAAGTQGEVTATAYISDVFASLGYSVTLQPFVFNRAGDPSTPYTATNVIALKPGRAGYGTLYLGAHYDTVYHTPGIEPHLGGPGANDNASGVGVLLETARVLANEPVSPTIKFIAFSAEELGLVGSYYYVKQMSVADRLTAEAMLNMDCVGLGDRLVLYAAVQAEIPFVQGLGSGADEVVVWENAPSDQRPFAAAQIPTAFFNVYQTGGNPCGPNYHMATDTIDTLQPAAIARVGEAVVNAVHTLTADAQPRQVRYLYMPFVGMKR